MPTPNERNALIFLAALGALGVGVRAFRDGPAPPPPTGESRAALDRQIGAVDSASAKRAPPPTRANARRRRVEPAPPDSQAKAARGTATRARPRPPAVSPPAKPDTAISDPLARYEARRLDVARANQITQARIDRDRSRVDGTRAGDGNDGASSASAHGPAGAARRDRPVHRDTVDLDTAGEDEVAALPWVGPVLAARIVADRSARGPFGSLEGLQRVRGVGAGLTGRIRPFVTFSKRSSGAETAVKFRSVRVRPPRP